MTPPVASTLVPSNGEFSLYKPMFAIAVFSMLVAYAGFYVFQQIEEIFESEELVELGSICDEKAAQITAWRNSQIRVGETLSRDSVLAKEFGQWLQAGALPDERMQQLRKLLEEVRIVSNYKSILLLDNHAAVRISPVVNTGIDEEEAKLALLAMQKREVLFYDIHRNRYGDKGISIDLIAPLIVGGKNHRRAVGAAVLQIDPGQFLYPAILSWPTAAVSAETLLVRKDGNDVVYLNELKYRSGAALTVRAPLDTPKSPAALAVLGEFGTRDGIDYRGVQVIAEMRPVPDTSWFVVSKVDREELLAFITPLKKLSLGVGIVLAAIGTLIVLFWYRGQTSLIRFLRKQHDDALERAMLVKHFEYLTKYANDIIIVANEAGDIVEVNERALEAYGYSREEFLRLHIIDLRDKADDPNLFRSQLEQLKEFGELRYESVTVRKDGTLFPIEISARLIKLDGVNYIDGIARDISERKRDEETLRRNETLLKKSQQMAQIGSWELDLKKNILYWSEENYRIFEFEQGEFCASYEAFLNTIHPEDLAMVNKAYTDSVKNRTGYTIVHRLLFPDRRIKFVREWGETIYDEAGQPLRSIGTTQDITRQELARHDLSRSAIQIEDLYNRSPCGYHSLDKDGLFIQINDTELEWLGYTRNEVVGNMSLMDLLTPASQQTFQDNYSRLKNRGAVHDVEYELIRKDGTHFPALLNASAIYDAAGQYVMSRATMFDITARKQVENRLLESEARFRTMVDNAPIMIWMVDAQNRQAYLGRNYFNQRWYQYTGMKCEQKPSSNWQNLIHADDRRRCLDIYHNAFENQQSFKVEYRLRCHDGVFRWIEDAGVPRFDAVGEYLGFIGTCIDITGRNVFELMRQEMEHIGRLNIAGEMASGLAHELSQPLTAANTYLAACLRRMEDRDPDYCGINKYITMAHAQTERAGQIIKHLKELVGKRKLERNMLDINLVIGDSLKFLEHELQQAFISVTLDVSPLPPVSVNKIEIEQVLINLIKNAIESMSSTSQRELLIVTRVIESGSILVKVSDTGKGIAEEAMDLVFDPFYTSKQDGLGLGLAICRSLVENYGGRIWVERKDDAGIEFNFTIAVGGAS